jgi:hypothetical protein
MTVCCFARFGVSARCVLIEKRQHTTLAGMQRSFETRDDPLIRLVYRRRRGMRTKKISIGDRLPIHVCMGSHRRSRALDRGISTSQSRLTPHSNSTSRGTTTTYVYGPSALPPPPSAAPRRFAPQHPDVHIPIIEIRIPGPRANSLGKQRCGGGWW